MLRVRIAKHMRPRDQRCGGGRARASSSRRPSMLFPTNASAATKACGSAASPSSRMRALSFSFAMAAHLAPPPESSLTVPHRRPRGPAAASVSEFQPQAAVVTSSTSVSSSPQPSSSGTPGGGSTSNRGGSTSTQWRRHERGGGSTKSPDPEPQSSSSSSPTPCSIEAAISSSVLTLPQPQAAVAIPSRQTPRQIQMMTEVCYECSLPSRTIQIMQAADGFWTPSRFKGGTIKKADWHVHTAPLELGAAPTIQGNHACPQFRTMHGKGQYPGGPRTEADALGNMSCPIL